jgi:hypothetical protein
MTTPDSVISQISQRSKEHQALLMLWESVLPGHPPGTGQLNIWLNRYPFEIVVKGINRCGDKCTTLLNTENREMDHDYMIRYASGVMVASMKETPNGVR